MDYFDWVAFLRASLPQIKDEVIIEIAKRVEIETDIVKEDAYQEGYVQGCQDSANDF